ncbi:MAG: molecular chaperone HtpG, partial [Thiohalophilus sp.]
GALDLGELEDQAEKEKAEKAEQDYKSLLERMQKVLEGKVKEVKVSHRLTDSPSCLVVSENEMAMSMQKLLKQAGHNVPNIEPVLEINPDHPLVTRLQKVEDEQDFDDWSWILFEQAMLSEGGQLEDPVAYVSRVNRLLQEIGG